MKKILVVIAVLILAGAGYYYIQHNQAKAPVQDLVKQEDQPVVNNPQPSKVIDTPSVTTSTSASVKTGLNTPAGNAQGTFSSGEASDGVDIQVVQVTYDGLKFSPAVENIKVGDWVIFKNSGKNSFWPASNPHPAHTDYPSFDSMHPVSAGGQYKFQFTKPGNWGYHDHLNSSATGVINVTK